MDASVLQPKLKNYPTNRWIHLFATWIKLEGMCVGVSVEEVYLLIKLSVINREESLNLGV